MAQCVNGRKVASVRPRRQPWAPSLTCTPSPSAPASMSSTTMPSLFVHSGKGTSRKRRASSFFEEYSPKKHRRKQPAVIAPAPGLQLCGSPPSSPLSVSSPSQMLCKQSYQLQSAASDSQVDTTSLLREAGDRDLVSNLDHDFESECIHPQAPIHKPKKSHHVCDIDHVCLQPPTPEHKLSHNDDLDFVDSRSPIYSQACTFDYQSLPSPPDHHRLPHPPDYFVYRVKRAPNGYRSGLRNRIQKYGERIAIDYRRGFTPPEARDKFKQEQARRQQELDDMIAASASESEDQHT